MTNPTSPAPSAPPPYARALYDALTAAQEELRLIRMKDTAACYNPTLSTQITLALDGWNAALAAQPPEPQRADTFHPDDIWSENELRESIPPQPGDTERLTKALRDWAQAITCPSPADAVFPKHEGHWTTAIAVAMREAADELDAAQSALADSQGLAASHEEEIEHLQSRYQSMNAEYTFARKRLMILADENLEYKRALAEGRAAERSLSDAYVRLRAMIPGAFDTPHAPSPEQVWQTTEEALARMQSALAASQADVARLTDFADGLQARIAALHAPYWPGGIQDHVAKLEDELARLRSPTRYEAERRMIDLVRKPAP